MEDAIIGQCKVCAAVTTFKCSDCLQEFYCSREHIRADRRSHKRLCRPFKIEQNERLGRYLVTTRKIKPFEIILKEKPLIRGPSQYTVPVCLGCLNAVNEQSHVPCTYCGWPLCSKECEDNPEHKEECQLTQQRRDKRLSVTMFSASHPMYKCIFALRALLLKKRPRQFEELNKLESLGYIRRGSQQWSNDLEEIAKYIPRLFQTDQFTEDEIMNITGILQKNTTEVPTTKPPHVAVFRDASLIEHSCKPNLARSFTKEGQLHLWAPQTIPKNTHLSLCYTDATFGTANRQRELMKKKFFKCECVRCKDVTEFGTNYNALKCKKENCSGVVLPDSLEDWCQNWKCLCCGDDVDKQYVNEILENARRELTRMEPNIANYLKYIEDYQKWLPRTNFYICEAKSELVRKLGRHEETLSEITDENLEKKYEYAKELLDLYEVLAPCEQVILVGMCLAVTASIREKRRRQTDNKPAPELLQEALKCMEKAFKYIQRESFRSTQMIEEVKKERDRLRTGMGYL